MSDSVVFDTQGAGLATRVFRRNAVLLALVLIHTAAALAVSFVTGTPMRSEVGGTIAVFLMQFTPQFLLVLLLWRLIANRLRHADAPLPARVMAEIRTLFGDPERLVGGILALVLVFQICSTASYVRGVIPALIPFGWDPLLADLDAAVHFGHAPHEWLAPLLEMPSLLWALNQAYHVWVLLLYFALMVACFAPRGDRSSRMFLLALAMTWIVAGNLLAVLLASGGPVYYEALGHGDRFAGLMQTLHAANDITPLPALELQDLLWRSYELRSVSLGITAMPSLHVAFATLMALFAWRSGRIAGYAMILFLAAIFLGSVLLAWHYAIDGYAGAALALAFWWLADRIVPRAAG